MSKFLASCALAALVGAAAAPAIAETPEGLYIGGAFGANWVDSTEFPGIVGMATDVNTFGTGAIGYKLSPNWRIELELGLRGNGWDEDRPAPNLAGSSQAVSAMFNGMYDISLAPQWDQSLGAGLGMARIGYQGGNGPRNLFLDGRDWVFAWQANAEVQYLVSANIGVYLGYSHFRAENFEVPVLDRTGAAIRLFKDDYVANSWKLGVRYYFGAPAPETPPPPPPLPPVQPAKTFIVFFDFNRSELTPTAQATIGEAAAAFAATGSVSVQVVGHTDTVGGVAYNQKLSERRAASVKAGLVSAGVPDGVIATSGRGFSEPLVPTGPGVEEPQNRRATIDLSGSAGM